MLVLSEAQPNGARNRNRLFPHREHTEIAEKRLKEVRALLESGYFLYPQIGTDSRRSSLFQRNRLTKANLRIPFLELVNQLLYLLNGELLIILVVRIVTQAVLEGVYGLGI